MIVVQNLYYARPGAVEAVEAVRRRASEVRVALGLPRGRILRRAALPPAEAPGPAGGAEAGAARGDVAADGSDADASAEPGSPDFIWECDYPDPAARRRDIEVTGASAEFRAVQAEMRPLLRRFERRVFEVCDEAGAPGTSTSPSTPKG